MIMRYVNFVNVESTFYEQPLRNFCPIPRNFLPHPPLLLRFLPSFPFPIPLRIDLARERTATRISPCFKTHKPIRPIIRAQTITSPPPAIKHHQRTKKKRLTPQTSTQSNKPPKPPRSRTRPPASHTATQSRGSSSRCHSTWARP